MNMPTKEELSRILVWIAGPFIAGVGTEWQALFDQFTTPQAIGVALTIVAAVWRAFRPPVVVE